MTYSTSGNNTATLINIQSQLQYLIANNRYAKNDCQGGNFSFKFGNFVYNNNHWFSCDKLNPIGTTQENGWQTALNGTGTDSALLGNIIPSGSNNYVQISPAISGRFLYRQYFLNKGVETLNLDLTVNGEYLLANYPLHTGNPTGILFTKEWEIDTTESPNTVIRATKISGTAVLSLGAFQLIPLI